MLEFVARIAASVGASILGRVALMTRLATEVAVVVAHSPVRVRASRAGIEGIGAVEFLWYFISHDDDLMWSHVFFRVRH